MKKAVTLIKKREYIHWFLSKYQLKNPETAKLLCFLMENDTLLKRVRFTENIRYYSDAVLISANDAKTVPYLYRMGNQYFYDTEEFIQVLEKSPPDRLYIWLAFNKDFICSFCSHVLEKRSAKGFSKKQLRRLEREISEQILLKESAQKHLLDLIDKALDKGNREDFFRLTHQLKRINKV